MKHEPKRGYNYVPPFTSPFRAGEIRRFPALKPPFFCGKCRTSNLNSVLRLFAYNCLGSYFTQSWSFYLQLLLITVEFIALAAHMFVLST